MTSTGNIFQGNVFTRLMCTAMHMTASQMQGANPLEYESNVLCAIAWRRAISIYDDDDMLALGRVCFSANQGYMPLLQNIVSALSDLSQVVRKGYDFVAGDHGFDPIPLIMGHFTHTIVAAIDSIRENINDMFAYVIPCDNPERDMAQQAMRRRNRAAREVRNNRNWKR